MTTPELERLRRLIARATHESTPVEEARTCGVIACRLIDRLGLLDQASAPQQPIQGPSPWRKIRSRYEATCRLCGAFYSVGEVVAWRRGEGVRCLECV